MRNSHFPRISASCLLLSLILTPPLAAQLPGESVGTALHVRAIPFIASPFASEFVITGAEFGLGDRYFPSNGDGTFGALTDIPDLGTVDGVDVADMDNDGDNDFVICDGISANVGEVFLYTNNGGGSFTPSLIASGQVRQV